MIGVRARPALKTCERTVIPFAAGVFRPVILLPTFAISGMTQAELDAICLHELAHIGRGDLIVNVVQRVAESFFFFNPATWYISRVITTERENCCDDVVLGQCDQSTYASALIRLAESLTGKPEEVAPVVALAATGAKPSQLKRRVQRILGVPAAPRGPSVGVVLSCVLVVAIAAVQLHAQTDGKETPGTGDFLNATDKNGDLELRTPLIISFNKKGDVAGFTTFNLDSSMSDSAQRDRFNLILEYIQGDKSIVIESTRVRRKQNGTLAMTVVGKNLDNDAIQNAIRKADTPIPKNIPLNSHLDSATIAYPAPEIWGGNLTERRLVKYSNADLGDTSEAVAQINKALDEATHMSVSQKPLAEVIATISEQYKIGIVFDREALDKEDIDPSKVRVSIKTLGVSLRRALRAILHQLKLTYVVDHEVLSITSQSKAEEILAGKVESVDALAIPLNNVAMGDIAARLEQLERMERQLSKFFLDSHPEMKRIRESSDKLRSELKTLNAPRSRANRRAQLEALIEKESQTSDGPIKIEFVDDSDVFVVRGKKEDVDHIMKLVEQSGLDDAENSSNRNNQELKRSDYQLRAKVGSDGEDTYHVFDLKNVIAWEARKELVAFLLQHEKDITVDTKRNGVVVSSKVSRENLAIIQNTLEQMDRRAEGTTILKSYDARLAATLKVVFEGVDGIRMQNHARNDKVLMVDAPMAMHQQIEAMIRNTGQPLEAPNLAISKVLANGKTLYQQHCSSCHGTNGNGDGPTAEFLDPAPRRFASEDYSKVRMGTADARKDLEALLHSGIKGTAMPSFKQLTQNERSSIAAYAEFLALRGRYRKERNADFIVEHVPASDAPEGALRFPIEIERAMMGGAAAAPIRKGASPRAFEIFTPNMIVPESIEKGMQVDAIEGGKNKY